MFVCRVFKITPEKKYLYKNEVIVDDAKLLRVNDIVLSIPNHTQWLVLNIVYSESLVTLINLEPTVFNGSIAGNLVRISSVCSSRSVFSAR
jgi:hypothetical protein